MKKEIDFKAWLEQGGAQSDTGRNTRFSAIRTIERKLEELEMPFQDLDAAWEADGFESLRERLRRMREDAHDGGQDYRILMPDSENPLNRLSSWRSWLGQYGRFLAGEPPGPAKDANRIRQYVLEHYIEPAREEGRRQAEVLVSDVNEELGLNKAWPNICQALAGNKFQELAQVPPPELIGAVQSPATVFRFDLSDHRVDRSALDQLRDRFLFACPDFRNFVDPGTGWARDEKAYKVAASERVRAALEEGRDEEALGKAVFEILKTSVGGPFVRWQTEDSIAKQYSELLGEFHAVIGQLIQSDQPAEEVLLQAYDSLDALKKRGAASLTYGERINILFSALSMVRPLEAASIKITRINEAWVKLTGKKLFVEATADMESDYRRFADVFSELFSIMRDDWRWQPQDWIDIQGFLWIATEPLETDVSTNTSNNRGKSMPISPTNLILYGPPGTGKTYSTAEEAVRLCGEPVPDDREALMETYQRLLAAGRIEFVTFHQSMSYEDFVEGRQPTTESDEDDDSSTAGFRLETVPGIFRRMAKRAETSRGRSTDGNAITIAYRKVFKMSIGEANNPEDAHLFEEAIEGGYALLGWEDIDWSDDRYADREAIIEACQTEGEIEGHTEVNARSGSVQMPFIFRNRVHQGDIVIVSKGNSLFRAIGEFTGDYEYHPRPDDGYAHRRAVRWLWVDRQGVSVSEIYPRRFMQKSIYLLYDTEFNIPALERYLNSQQMHGPAEPFVLIIDEINRANISKVFGELITLLEPDKRLGQPNALKVRLPYSGDDFGVPSNLHILGTMNTADRSIALLDTALRRRFTFREIMPDPSLLAGEAGTCGLDLPRILATINERIEYLYDREHQIGHAYFTGCASRVDVDTVMRYKAIPLLAEYFFEDWEKIAAVLGDAVSNDGPITGGFLKRSVLKSPPGIEDGDALPRFRWEVRSEAEGFDYTGLTEA